MEVIFLLQAMDKQGRLLAIWNLNKRTWNKRKEVDPLFCPQCHEKVIAKFGQLKTPHFAHARNSSCSHNGESQYHEKGKRDLYDWLLNQGLNPKLEYYLPKTKQVADIYLRIGKKKIAIEYQCAKISTEEFVSRTTSYQQQQITPIWILGANRLKRIHEIGIQLNDIDKSFIHQYHPQYPLTLYFYCSETSYLILLQHCIFFSKTKVFGTFIAKSLNQLSVTDLFRIYPQASVKWNQAWKVEKRKWLHRPVSFYNYRENQWRQWLYQHQLTIQKLPSFVYLPVSEQYRMNEQPWRWQSKLYVELLMKRKPFTIPRAQQIVRHYYLPITQFPLIDKSADPVIQYVRLLVKRGLLKEQNGVFNFKENI